MIYTSKMDDLDVKNGDLAMENEDKHGDSNITWIWPYWTIEILEREV